MVGEEISLAHAGREQDFLHAYVGVVDGYTTGRRPEINWIRSTTSAITSKM